MFLGVCPEHSSNVVIALNLITGYVSPQFHTVHDDLFSTVFLEWESTNVDPDHWHSLLQSGQERYGDASINPSHLANEWLSPTEKAAQEQRHTFHRRHHEASRQRVLPPFPGPPSPRGGYLSQETFCLHNLHRKLVLLKMVLLRVIMKFKIIYIYHHSYCHQISNRIRILLRSKACLKNLNPQSHALLALGVGAKVIHRLV
jgi:hypothetical protein